MITLGIETTSRVGSVALVKDGSLVNELVIGHQLRHSNHIIPSIDHLLILSGYKMSDIDAIAVGAGPGSFTGIRVGMAIASGLAVNSGIRLVSVSSMYNIFDQVRDEKKTVHVLIHAQRDEFFAQEFNIEINDETSKMKECVILPMDDIIDYCKLDSLVCGYGLSKLSEQYKFDEKSIAVLLPELYPKAVNTALIGAEIILNNLDEQVFAPFYVRRSEAELKGAKVYKF